ncbi:hypothetical protein AAMO2058_001240800 [Amorphochlora amoebiformis]
MRFTVGTVLSLSCLASSAPLTSIRSPPAVRPGVTAGRSSIGSRLNKIVTRSTTEATEAPGAPAEIQASEPVKEPWKYAAGTAPLGPYFDPLGISKGKTESEMKRIREAEITHGRVAMLSVLGFLFQEALIDRPLFWSPDKGYVTGPAIYHFQEVAERYPYFWLATIPFFAYYENKRARFGWQDPTKGGDLFGIKEDYEPGDFGFDPFNAYPIDSKSQRDMKNKELNNGRLAMLASVGFMAQELVNGKTIGDNLGFDKLMPPHGPY